MFDGVLNMPHMDVFSYILRCVSPACIYLTTVCHSFSKNRVAQTFNLYCTPLQEKICSCIPLFQGEEYMLVRSKEIMLKRHPKCINNL